MAIYLQRRNFGIQLALMASLGLLLAACSDNNNDTPPPEPPQPPAAMSRSFEVTVTNLTANQPLSPIGTFQHTDNVQFWSAGQAASVALEKLAEGGDTSELATLQGVTASTTGNAPVGPGASETLTLEVPEAKVANLAVMSMLVNTNDAFSGVQSVDVRQLGVDQSLSFKTMAYDAGTEANSEAKGSIPGPADGGEGFNAARDDVNRVHIHPGVISADDGLSDSVLSASHRFDNPVMMVTITRTK
ncbi:spondin domain-containing protein [Shewanella sp. GXUN23E]|uniref:spondin domain-containing protein n=1 Tax=Shewanella sp. GXUN23E TaxID=3422498 RepID=UPI003D7EB0BC